VIQPAPSLFKASLWMVGWLVAMVTMAVAGREAALGIDAFQVMELRALIGFVLLLPLVFAADGFSAMKTQNLQAHFWRNSTHYCAQYLWLVSVTLIPLAQVVSIEFTMPIWTAIMAVIFLGERMNRWKVTAIVLGLIGVWLIVRPQAGASSALYGQLLALISSVGFAISVVMVRSLTRTNSVTQVIFWMLVIQGVIGFIPAVMFWKPIPAHVWPWVILVAFVGTFSHFCLAQALRYADATVVVPMDFLRVPLTAVAAYLFYREAIDTHTVIGAALILGGNLLNLKKPPPPKTG